MSSILSYSYNLKIRIARLKVPNKYEKKFKTEVVEVFWASYLGEMESKLEAFVIPLQIWDYESWTQQISRVPDDLSGKVNGDKVGVSSPMPSLLQGRPIKKAATIHILELKSTTIRLGQVRQRGVEWAQ